MNLLVIFYFLLLIFSGLIFWGFKKVRFPAISLVFSLALLLQALIPILYLYYLKEFERFTVDKDILINIMQAYGLYMIVAIVFLFLLLFVNKYLNRVQST
jgi:hypothetical protein